MPLKYPETTIETLRKSRIKTIEGFKFKIMSKQKKTIYNQSQKEKKQ